MQQALLGQLEAQAAAALADAECEGPVQSEKLHEAVVQEPVQFAWYGPRRLHDIAKRASQGLATPAEEELIVASLMQRLEETRAACV